MNNDSKSFTVAYSRRTNVLFLDVLIIPAFDASVSIQKKLDKAKEFKAIIDTGATGSVITENVVNQCNLQPTGMITVHTANGIRDCNTYFVDMVLPSKVIIQNMTVSESIIKGADILIGMDIIGQSDFAVTNVNNKTKCSLRIPSQEDIDFVKQSKNNIVQAKSSKIGRNEPCWCGSGKKFKRCHGQYNSL